MNHAFNTIGFTENEIENRQGKFPGGRLRWKAFSLPLKVVHFNQWLSFSPLTAKISFANTVFWPGCAVLKLDPACVRVGYGLLKKTVPEAGFATLCCGKPTFAVLDKHCQEKRLSQLKKRFEKAGTKTIYTLCPNCTATLKACFPDICVLPAWPVIAKNLEESGSGLSAYQGEYMLHDPCGDRFDMESQEAVRLILKKMAVAYGEFRNNRENTRCCGRKNMLFLTNSSVSDKMLLSRLEEGDGKSIITYCESCAEAFRSKGREAFHILELVAGGRTGRSFFNRIKAKKEMEEERRLC